MLENYSRPPDQSWLTWFYRGLLVLGALVMFGRLAELQVIKGAYYRSLADGNRARRVPIQAQRGKILARDGELLADNQKLPKTVVFDPTEGYEKVDADKNTKEEDLIYEWKRKYPLGSSAAHLIGFLGEVNKEELGKIDPNCAQKGVRTANSLVGRTGLEQYYDCLLRGVDGEEIVEVDTSGKKSRNLGRRNPIPGKDLQTTIDYKIQKKLSEIMGDKKGAAVVSKPNGEILAMVSSPSYDPNSNFSDALVDKNLPMFNRAIGGVYHPGSIFKILISTAGFEDGVVGTDYTYTDTGVVSVDDYQYTNWYYTQYGGKEGEINTVRALARSTDTFYYKLGEKIGVDKIDSWSEKFGLKDKTGIDLPGEVVGLVPTPEWKKAVKGERWYLGNTYHLSIGQGDLTATPIAVHRIAQTIANGGKLCEPYLTLNKGESCKSLNISQKTLDVIKEGMKGACAPGGTGVPFFNFEPEVGCKTGTAETFENKEPHAWFTVFTPFDHPDYVVTVLVENGGEGSKVAAPIAREILDYIYHP